MVTLRCTQKLLRRLEVTDKPAAPTPVLGDWYANILFSRPHQLVLCVSERSLLPVVLLAKEPDAGKFPYSATKNVPGAGMRNAGQ